MRTVISVQTSLVCSSILRWGTEEQKQHYLPKLCSGEWLGCFGLTEPDTGSDAANQKTRATQDRRRLGDHRQQDVDLARQPRQGRADLRPDRPREAATAGSRASSSDTRHAGLLDARRSTGRWACTAPTPPSLALDDVEVADDALMGEVGDGFKIAMSALDSGRYRVAAGCVGICQGSLDASVAYAKEREQFGRPIASFQLVQAMIADMRVADRRRAHARLARRLPQGPGPPVARPRRRSPSSTRPRRRRTARTSAIQVHGGVGLRRRPPGRALLPRRARDDALRGHLADPEADHRPRRDRDQRAHPGVQPSGVVGVVGAGTMGAGIAQLAGARRARARCCTTPTRPRSSAAPMAIARAAARASVETRALERRRGAATRRAGRRRSTLADLAGCDLVIEAAPESLELKRDAVRAARRDRRATTACSPPTRRR